MHSFSEILGSEKLRSPSHFFPPSPLSSDEGTLTLSHLMKYITCSRVYITQHHAAARSTTQHHAAPRSTTQYHAAPHSTPQHHAAAHSSTQHHAALHSTPQYPAAPRSTVKLLYTKYNADPILLRCITFFMSPFFRFYFSPVF